MPIETLTIEEVISELCSADPKFQDKLNQERERLEEMKQNMGKDAFTDYVCGHFVRISDGV